MVEGNTHCFRRNDFQDSIKTLLESKQHKIALWLRMPGPLAIQMTTLDRFKGFF